MMECLLFILVDFLHQIIFRTINCFELQELLEACLPNDYIKSCASLDICRQIVSLVDVSLLFSKSFSSH